jgi:hypothetical protein
MNIIFKLDGDDGDDDNDSVLPRRWCRFTTACVDESVLRGGSSCVTVPFVAAAAAAAVAVLVVVVIDGKHD